MDGRGIGGGYCGPPTRSWRRDVSTPDCADSSSAPPPVGRVAAAGDDLGPPGGKVLLPVTNGASGAPNRRPTINPCERSSRRESAAQRVRRGVGRDSDARHPEQMLRPVCYAIAHPGNPAFGVVRPRPTGARHWRWLFTATPTGVPPQESRRNCWVPPEVFGTRDTRRNN